jgi:asparagine synthase (glutamine-hydrolysing)
MRRLSILDSTPAGHQPMSSNDGRFTIVYNGEIYNFLELADELEATGHRFTTRTDTEVILAAYAAWGPRCVRRFNGIWAFAIWDAAEETLLLSRDRVGVKPLFIADAPDGGLAFASEIKAIRTLPWISSEPRADVIRDYLIDGTHDHSTKTFFRLIDALPAAHTMLVHRDGRRTVERYWGPIELNRDASFEAQPKDAELIDGFRETLIDAVRLQLRSDVPIGSCLSGGLDSSSIVCIAAGLRTGTVANASQDHRERDASPQLAFFAEFDEAGINERPYVDAVLAQTGVTLKTTSPDADSFLTSLRSVLTAQDEPFGSLSIIAQFHVMRLAHEEGVKVLLDGQGADELLGGYPNYHGMRMAGALRTVRRAELATAGLALARRDAPLRSTLGYALVGNRPLPPALIRGRMPAGWLGAGVAGSAKLDGEGSGTLLATKLWHDISSGNLPALLRYEDRNSMAWGIEARVPFLDHRVIEASMRLPDRLKIDARGRRKIVLRRAMRGIVPEVVLGRHDKVAFQPPERQWLLGAEPTWRRLAGCSVAEREGYLSAGTVREALDSFTAGRVSPRLSWRVLNLELWLRDLAGEPFDA